MVTPFTAIVWRPSVSEQDGVVAERHPELADGTIDVDPELVGEPQQLALADVDLHDRVAGVIAEDPLEPLDLQLVEGVARAASAAAVGPGRR